MKAKVFEASVLQRDLEIHTPVLISGNRTIDGVDISLPMESSLIITVACIAGEPEPEVFIYRHFCEPVQQLVT
jgi:hypothetical protein